MKKFVLLAVLAFATPAFAQLRCIDKLLPVARPSASHYLTSSEWVPNPGDQLTAEGATRGLNAFIFGKLLCRETEIEIPTPASCGTIDATQPSSMTCYAQSSLGNFVLVQDNDKNLQIIFTKIRRNP
jgi:hypothetical protein